MVTATQKKMLVDLEVNPRRSHQTHHYDQRDLRLKLKESGCSTASFFNTSTRPVNCEPMSSLGCSVEKFQENQQQLGCVSGGHLTGQSPPLLTCEPVSYLGRSVENGQRQLGSASALHLASQPPPLCRLEHTQRPSCTRQCSYQGLAIACRL